MRWGRVNRNSGESAPALAERCGSTQLSLARRWDCHACSDDPQKSAVGVFSEHFKTKWQIVVQRFTQRDPGLQLCVHMTCCKNPSVLFWARVDMLQLAEDSCLEIQTSRHVPRFTANQRLPYVSSSTRRPYMGQLNKVSGHLKLRSDVTADSLIHKTTGRGSTWRAGTRLQEFSSHSATRALGDTVCSTVCSTVIFHFIPKVLDEVEVRSLCRPVKFFHTKQG